MALNDYETSVESGQPVELYLFRWGVGVNDYYAYTDGESAVTYDSIVYEPLAGLERDDFEAGQSNGESEIKVKLPINGPIPELFRIYPPPQVVTLVIRQGHIPNADDPVEWAAGENFPVAWMGRILEVFREAPHAELICEIGTASMNRPGLRQHYQWECRYARLFHGRCGASKVAASVTATVSAVTGNRVTLTEPWVQSGRVQSDYLKGTLEWTTPSGQNEVRTILRVEGTNVLVLTGPANGLAVSDTPTVVRGCNRTMTVCAEGHDAIQTYGGFPGIPTFNPTAKNNHT